MANLSKTPHINYYQIRSSIVEVMIKKNLVCFLCLTVYNVSMLAAFADILRTNMLKD